MLKDKKYLPWPHVEPRPTEPTLQDHTQHHAPVGPAQHQIPVGPMQNRAPVKPTQSRSSGGPIQNHAPVC